jgi:protein-S-isoprenylcysteine O-methyltransferase Ste14
MALRDELEKHGEWLFRRRSYLPLLILPILLVALRNSEGLEQVFGDLANGLWEAFCIVISLTGFAVRCITVGFVPCGTSGRNTEGQIAESLNTTGMYSIVRHPLYLGNFFIFLGFALFIEVWWFTLIAVLAFWLYYERIVFAEEEFLRRKFGDAFLQWTGKTPAFIPKFRNWQPWSLPFSLKNVLQREYTGLFVITTSFTILEILGDLLVEGELEIDLPWVIMFIVGLTIYSTLRTLKKKTRILYVEGR